MNVTPKITDVQTKRDFKLIHIDGSIFDSPHDLPMVHAVSQDGKFGAGLARDIEIRFGIKDEFRLKVKQCPDVVPVRRGQRIILNVVTKNRYFQKPNPKSVREALLMHRQWMERNYIKECCYQNFPVD